MVDFARSAHLVLINVTRVPFLKLVVRARLVVWLPSRGQRLAFVILLHSGDERGACGAPLWLLNPPPPTCAASRPWLLWLRPIIFVTLASLLPLLFFVVAALLGARHAAAAPARTSFIIPLGVRRHTRHTLVP